jgi:hypothetical protein
VRSILNRGAATVAVSALLVVAFGGGCGASPPGRGRADVAAATQGVDRPCDYGRAREEPLTAIGAIVAGPGRYHGKQVTIEGTLAMRFEETAVYAVDQRIVGTQFNAAWLDFRTATALPMDEVRHGRVVRVTGTVNATGRGHRGRFSFEISPVASVRGVRTDAR